MTYVANIEVENKEIAKLYRDMLSVTYQTLSKKDNKEEKQKNLIFIIQ